MLTAASTPTTAHAAMAISSEERDFFIALGERIQVAALPVVARTLSASLEELFGEGKQGARGKRVPAPRWQQQIEAVAKLPNARQRFVSEMLDTVLAQH